MTTREEVRTPRTAFFVYPNEESCSIFEMEDLSMDLFMVVCSPSLNTAFIWNGLEFEEDPNSPSKHEFLTYAIEYYFEGIGRPLDSIRVVEEQPTCESDEFLDQF